jgi:serine protease AprX
MFRAKVKLRKMKNITFFVSVIVLCLTGPAASELQSDMNAKVAKLDIDKATLDDVIRIFGEPTKYIWGQGTFTKDNLPSVYIAAYPSGFGVVIKGGKIHELRFERIDAGYVFKNKLRISSSLEEVLDVMGQPTETVVGEALPAVASDGVLYKDIDGRKGDCYYSRKDQNVRFFFGDYKVTALYVTCDSSKGSGGGSSFRTIQPIESVKEFDDVRNKDLSKLDLSKGKKLIRTLQFNRKTIWPAPEKMPVSIDPNQLLTDGMNPGLGIRELHREGITGKGVNVAIIDQAMYLDHPEFVGKIVVYHDIAAGNESSMHGPAVTSLLVGANCGTAPDARVYYVAARDMCYEVDYAEGLEWIIEQNAKLPVSEKIRVVSVSAAPGIAGTPSGHNQKRWNDVCARAEAAAITVLDCTEERKFIERCWYNPKVPESVAGCTPGHPKEGVYFPSDKILAPAWGRTIAEERNKGDFGYIYGRGGVSWSIPYCAGVLALGWQLRPDIPPEQMRELLFKSAYIKKDGAKIINPGRFIQLVKAAKGQSVSKGQGKAGND